MNTLTQDRIKDYFSILKITRYYLAISILFILSGCTQEKEGSKISNSQHDETIVNISVSNSNNKLVLNWDMISNAESYNIYWGNKVGVTPETATGSRTAIVTNSLTLSAGTNVGTGTGTGTVDIAINQPYYIIASFVKESGVESKLSTEINTFVGDGSNLPVIASASAIPGQIELSWVAVEPNVDSYRLYWSSSSTNESAIIGENNIINFKKNVIKTTLDVGSIGGAATHSFVMVAFDENLAELTKSNVVSASANRMVLNSSNNPAIGKIQLHWDEVSGADSYNIKWSTTNNFTVELGSLSNITGSNKTFDMGDLGYTGPDYYFLITYNKNGKESLAIDTPSIGVLQGTLQGISSLNAKLDPDSVGSVILKWLAVDNVNDYTVYWSTTDGVYTATDSKILGNTTTATLTIPDVVLGTNNYFVVTYTMNGTKSIISNRSSVAPTSITSLNAKLDPDSVGSVILKWLAVDNVNNYTIYWSTTDGVYTATNSKILGNTTTATLTIPDVVLGTNNYFVITYTLNGTKSIVSNQASATPVTINSLDAVNTAADLIGGVTLNWDTIANATDYRVYWSTTSGSYTENDSFLTGGTNTATLTVPKVILDTNNYFVVKYVIDGGKSDKSNEVSKTPTKLALTVSNPGSIGGTQLSWSDASTYVNDYTLSWTDGTNTYTNNLVGGTNTALVNTLSTINNSTFIANTNYTFSLKVGGVTVSNTITDTPAPLILTAQTGTDTVTLSWTASPYADSYIVYWNNNGSESKLSEDYQNSAATDTTTISLSTANNVAIDLSHQFSVALVKDGITSAHSTNIARAGININSVTDIVVTTSSGNIHLSWLGDTNIGYKVYWGDVKGTFENGGDGKPTGSVTGKSGSDFINHTTKQKTFVSGATSFIPGETYYFVIVKIFNIDSESLFDRQISAAADVAIPDNPESVATSYANTILIQWLEVNAPSKGYKLYYSTNTYTILGGKFNEENGLSLNLNSSFYATGTGTATADGSTVTINSHKFNIDGDIEAGVTYYFILLAVETGDIKSIPTSQISAIVEAEDHTLSSHVVCSGTHAECLSLGKTLAGFLRGCNVLDDSILSGGNLAWPPT